MNVTATASRATDLSPAQAAALVRLLEDDDPGVYQAVRDRILACGPSALGWLQPHALDRHPLIRRRTIELSAQIERSQADNQFLSFCLGAGEEFDLERAVWMLALTQYPLINRGAYEALLDNYAADAQEQSASGHGAREMLGGLNRHLFQELGFCGNEETYYSPENSYLNRVIDRRTGNPIALCALYLFVGRRLRLPLVGIGMPGHFICRYLSSTEVLYVDVFHRGRFLTKDDCVRHLRESGHGFHEAMLAPSSPRRMLLRMCSNLQQIYLHLKLAEETARLQRYVVALAK